MNFEEKFLEDTHKRFLQYKDLGAKTFAQLGEMDFFYQPSSESNSIAIIIQHLHGNMMSRFTNFLAEDGEKPWRKRDAEFEVMNLTREDLLSLWNTGWTCVFDALDSLQPEDIQKTVYIRAESMTVCDALLRQLAHYSYHLGQIVYVAKMLKDKEWNTLSIPRGKSQQFNEQMAQPK